MLETAKALAAFLKEGGAYAVIGMLLAIIAYLYRRVEKLQERSLEKQDSYSQQIIELASDFKLTVNEMEKKKRRRRASRKGGNSLPGGDTNDGGNKEKMG